MQIKSFVTRHLGPRENEIQEMLDTIGVSSLDELINNTIPSDIRLKQTLNLPEPLTEYEFSKHIKYLGDKNKQFKTYIGLGYHPAILPAVIQRNVFENPSWYTSYTPYQAEISQGRLSALLNFQTIVSDLTGFSLANSSLLDEGTAAAEAMVMLYNARKKTQVKEKFNQFFVDKNVLPQTISILETRATPLGIKLIIGDCSSFKFTENIYGALVQYPNKNGAIFDYTDFINTANKNGAKVVVAADLLSLALLKTPADMGADIAIGTTQRFGIPLGYGGPHAAYFATTEQYKRLIPGRIIGVSVDTKGNKALRMALQTREQHIKREKATSNICTSQVLLAVMAGFYGVYHGSEGIKDIALNIHYLATILSEGIKELGLKQENKTFFGTIQVKVSNANIIKSIAESQEVNFLIIDKNTVGISLNETTNIKDVNTILEIFAKAKNKEFISKKKFIKKSSIPNNMLRDSSFMTNEVFKKYHSETEMMRYIKSLELKDLSLTHSMISLGSCTMKLNSAAELLPLSNSNWYNIHPFAPLSQAQGYKEMLRGLEEYLTIITGFSATSLQPNSGAQGEYTGLMTIRRYHESKGESNRDIILIPASAHGTNPASAHMAGFKIIVIKTTTKGNIDIDDLKEKASSHKSNLAGLMVTYPSTHGVFESSIKKITKIIHQYGGQVYMDGANMNAQVGLTNPAAIGADVCHLNLHKTFAIPHGGGGPGVGPICVAAHLAKFLPSNPIQKTGGANAISAISSAPWGSALIDIISYAYIKMLGEEGLTMATKYAILNANYLKAKFNGYYNTLYTGENGFVGHEMILDFKEFKHSHGIDVTDVSKRLMDYGYHAPTVSFPVHNTLMIEPTESEGKEELDKFADTLIKIREEIEEYSNIEDSVLKNAPHTLKDVTSTNWEYSYTREEAAFPLPFVKNNKFWPSVNRVNNAYGDRNLVCSCSTIMEELLED